MTYSPRRPVDPGDLSAAIGVATGVRLPATRMSWPGSCFSFATSPATLPLITVELLHEASLSVLETTNFAMLFILSAKPVSSVLEGQASAKA